MIEYEAALVIYAEISAALAGFVGIITVFGRRWERGEWSRTERLMLHSMLITVLTNLGAALLPLALVSAFSDEQLSWRIANGFLGLSHLVALVWSLPILSGISSLGVPKIIMPPIGFLGVTTHGASVAGAAGLLGAYTPFALLWGLWWGIFVGAFLFAVLLFSSGRNQHSP